MKVVVKKYSGKRDLERGIAEMDALGYEVASQNTQTAVYSATAGLFTRDQVHVVTFRQRTTVPDFSASLVAKLDERQTDYQPGSEEQLAAALAACRAFVLNRLREMTPEHLGYVVGSGHFTRAEYVEAVEERLSGMSQEDRRSYDRGMRRRKRSDRT